MKYEYENMKNMRWTVDDYSIFKESNKPKRCLEEKY